MVTQSNYHDEMYLLRTFSATLGARLARVRHRLWAASPRGPRVLSTKQQEPRVKNGAARSFLTAFALLPSAFPTLAAPPCSAEISSFRASANGQYTEIVGSATCDGVAQVALFTADGRQALDVVEIDILGGAFKTLSNRLPKQVKYRITFSEQKPHPPAPGDQPQVSDDRPVQNKCTVAREGHVSVVTCAVTDNEDVPENPP